MDHFFAFNAFSSILAKPQLINILPISFLLFALLALPAMADTYSVDGDISDWGVDLSKAYGTASDNETGWIPISHNGVDFIVENNIDPRYNNGFPLFDHAGSVIGAHMQRNGTSSSISPYEEPRPKGSDGYVYIQPASGEDYDLEALYFDDNNTDIFIALVTSVNPRGTGDMKLGDIALDINNDGRYEYGVNTSASGSSTNGTIIENPGWNKTQYFVDSDPYKMTSGSFAGKGNVTVRQVSVKEKIKKPGQAEVQKDNWVLEASLPKSVFENLSPDQKSGIHITITCENDEIEL